MADADGSKGAAPAQAAATDGNQPRQLQQQPQQEQPKNNNTISSDCRRLAGPNQVDSPSSSVHSSVHSAVTSNPVSVRFQLQSQKLWRPGNEPNQRARLIRHLRAELGRADANGALPGSYMSGATVNYELDENVERGNWSGSLDFLLSCLGYAVGLGNVWRFPYLCFVNGGGAFLVPYTIFLFLCGIPMFLLDLSLGQFTSEGPVTCWEFAPIFIGVGYAMVFLSTISALYYNMIIAYSIHYLFASMTTRLPWAHCNNTWNTDLCSSRMPPLVVCDLKGQQPNGTCYNGTQLLGVFNATLFNHGTKLQRRVLPADEYFNHEVLKKSDTIDDFGTPDWKLILCLLTAWIIVFCCMVKGIKSSGKVVYFTALYPYVVLIVLFFRGISLSNAVDGIRFYIVPDFKKLANPSVWKDAAGQIFCSLSCSWGGLISLSSYNRFHNNVIRDTLLVTLTNSGTSLFAGFVIFSYIGHLAGLMKVKIQDVTQSGFGLAFIIYPEAVKFLPGKSLWAVLFFVMILTLGVDSQFVMVETLITSLCDIFRALRRHKPLLISFICLAGFLLGLPFCCPGGQHLMSIIDSYCGSWVILVIGFFECVALGWFYGRPGCGRFHRFTVDIGLMIRDQLWPVWRYLWQYITPSVILFIVIFNWIGYSRTEYVAGSGRYYPLWADMLGWAIALTAMLLIVGGALAQLLLEPPDMPWGARLFALSIPSFKWGPSLPRHRMMMAPYLERLGALRHFYLHPSKRIKYYDVFSVTDNRAVRVTKKSDSGSLDEETVELRIDSDLVEDDTGEVGSANPGVNDSTDV